MIQKISTTPCLNRVTVWRTPSVDDAICVRLAVVPFEIKYEELLEWIRENKKHIRKELT